MKLAVPNVTNWNRWSGPEFHLAFNRPLAEANMTIHLVTKCRRKRKSGAEAQTSADDSARATTEVSYIMRPSAEDTRKDPNISTHPTKWLRTKVGIVDELANAVAIRELLSLMASTLANRFPPGITIEPTHYVVGGLPIGTADGTAAYLAKLVDSYESTLAWFLSIPDVRRHAATLILLLCLRPSSLFNHHLRGTPPSFSLATAYRLRRNIVTAFAQATAIPADSLLASPPGTATTLQLLLAVSAGGIGLADLVSLAAPAFLASFADTLRLAPRENFGCWPPRNP